MSHNFSLLDLVQTKAHHLPNGRFTNPWFRQDAPALRKIIRWKLSHLIFREQPRFPVLDPRPVLAKDLSPLVVFLGHNTVFLRLNQHNLLFDPIFSHIGGLVKRHTPPPINPEELPPISYVLISHAHRDHFDLNALKKIPGTFKIIAPLGLRHYLPKDFLSAKRLVELDWLESFEEEGLRVIALPLQHWSKRNLTDTNISLWAGFLLTEGKLKLFLGGDTGYFFGFKEMGQLFGPIDLAFVPAGAFLPRWLMAPFHLSPKEAVKAAQDLEAKQAVPIHWGAYKLGDEALDDPPKLFKLAARKADLKPLILYPGEGATLKNGLFRPF